MSKNSRSEGRLSVFFDLLTEDLAAVPARDDVLSFAKNRLAERMRKRAMFTRPHLEVAALEKFLGNNERVGFINVVENDIVREARDFVYAILCRYALRFDPDDNGNALYTEALFDLWGFGPGASKEIKGTHTAQKINQKFTCTGPCEPLVRELRGRNPYMCLFDEKHGGGTKLVKGSRLSFVPKNEDTVRTIATEPSGNMALQLAVGRYLEGVLRSIGLDISTQQAHNRRLAKLGSFNNSLSTIDMSAASDSISIDVVRKVFPPKLVSLLLRLRCSHTVIPGGREVELNMISTMGNGFTFPLMTLLFVSIIYGYRRARLNGPKHFVDWRITAVNGDDIIVPTREFNLCIDSLEHCGFIVNTDKSFRDGPFRESCGGDYFNGEDVKPFYVQSLSTYSDIYVVSNQVLSFCGQHGIALPKTLRYLFSLLPKGPFLVPEWMNPDQGVQVQGCPTRFKYLAPRQEKVKLTNDLFLMPLVCGGFLEQDNSHFRFVPRARSSPRYKVRRARLPQGYLDGWDPIKRSPRVSSFINLLVQGILAA